METIRGRDDIPAGRVEELVGALDAIRMTLDILGPPTLGTQRLLAHWASREGSVRVSEDELLAEVRVAGADEWEQAVTEAERELHDASNRTLPSGELRCSSSKPAITGIRSGRAARCATSLTARRD